MPTCTCNACPACERRRTGGQLSLVSFVTAKQRLPCSVEFGPLPGVAGDLVDPSPFPNVRFVSYALGYLQAQVMKGRRVILPPKLQPPCVVPGEIATGLWTCDLDVLEGMRSHYNRRVDGLRATAAAATDPRERERLSREIACLSHLSVAETVLSVDRGLCAVYMRALERYTLRVAVYSVGSVAVPSGQQESADESSERLKACANANALLLEPIKNWPEPAVTTALKIVKESVLLQQAMCRTCPYRNPACQILLPTAELFDKWSFKYRSDAIYHQCREQTREKVDTLCVLCKREPRIIRAIPCGKRRQQSRGHHHHCRRARVHRVQVISACAAAVWRQ